MDAAGNAIGAAPKATVHGPDTPLHLAFSSYVFDSAGRLLLSRRASHKVTWPGVWTNSCCGHPLPAEPPAEAVTRRLAYELGLAVRRVDLMLPRFAYRAVMDDGTVENEMCPVFVATTSDAVRSDPAEVDDVEWVPWPEFRASVLDGSRVVSPWCVEQVAALPDDPLAASPADSALLPPAARA